MILLKLFLNDKVIAKLQIAKAKGKSYAVETLVPPSLPPSLPPSFLRYF
jgi:hypothetical protein